MEVSMAAKKKGSKRKYGKLAAERVAGAMRKLGRGTLRSGSGQKVKTREQAIAIGLAEAAREGGKVPKKPGPKKAARQRRKASSNEPACAKSGTKKAPPRTKATPKKKAAPRKKAAPSR
jgi:hypothetical protein